MEKTVKEPMPRGVSMFSSFVGLTYLLILLVSVIIATPILMIVYEIVTIPKLQPTQVVGEIIIQFVVWFLYFLGLRVNIATCAEMLPTLTPGIVSAANHRAAILRSTLERLKAATISAAIRNTRRKA